jgi:phage terminase large subunit
MYFEAIEWIKAGGALPPMDCPGVPELVAALSQTTYGFRGDRLLLEPKDQIKARLGYSPDDADAFALTFAQPAARRDAYAHRTPGRVLVDYDPLEDVA